VGEPGGGGEYEVFASVCVGYGDGGIGAEESALPSGAAVYLIEGFVDGEGFVVSRHR
jgi:hypothetical protein